MSGKITSYLDCVSPYSYFALVRLEENRQLLKQHNVEIDIVPVFLGGINVGSGNKPPWTLPAKAVYGRYDSERSKHYFGLPNVKTPEFFPILSLLPQRALVYIKEEHPQHFVTAFMAIFQGMWEHGLDVSKPHLLAQVLSTHFSQASVKDILEKANMASYKQRLNDNTKEALELGAFGCPWHVVRNSKGETELFFGSDR
ncbi:hypothetical protein ACEQ8H_002577 [Pleosporales sp. CAS-2024a]